jgi:outer membrane receptor for ferrienterochelin and colicins
MKNKKTFLLFLLIFTTYLGISQEINKTQKIKITGKVVEKISQQPLEYATITLTNTKNTKVIAGGITNAKGEFEILVNAGIYDFSLEYISFKPSKIKEQNLQKNTNIGTIGLEEDASQLNEVVIRSEKTTVDIKLDKKVYNVGKDLLVRGGTVSDVLDNIPSVSVASDGTISLRGNDNVRILIDGIPSNAINVVEALRQFPADAIEKVEVVTNPSARYDSEGGGGLLNIILKKGKNKGLNGTIIGSTGIPENYGVSTSMNYKLDKFNLFTNTGYNYRTNPTNSLTNTEYLNSNGETRNFIYEKRENNRLREGYNSSFGVDWLINKNTTWTNSINVRENNGTNPETVTFNNFNSENLFLSTNSRYNFQNSKSLNSEYTTNFIKKFKKEGHKINIDGVFSNGSENENSIISSAITEKTGNKQKQKKNTIQMDYVVPFGKASQFEIGYKGDFSTLYTDFKVGQLDLLNNYIPNNQYTNILDYKENVNAFYTQLGNKINKFSYLFGLRWEDSKIEVNQLVTNDFNTKKYNNFFPSAFFTYEITDKSSASISYSRRVSRPRGRMLNPFSNYSSNINIFKGNPDLNPSFTNTIDFGYLIRWEKLTFNTSFYTNKTTDTFQFVRRENGDFVDGVPVILSTPINLATEMRNGFEFTLNYSPFKWWKLNSNFNFFNIDTKGDYTYTNSQNVVLTQNFNNNTNSWFTRLTSKVSLPYKIDWQSNITYNGAQKNAQGRVLANLSANLGFSKDVLKDKGTIALNVQDVFNSRRRMFETNLPGVLNSYSELQWMSRQMNFSFTYRFNKKKEDRNKTQKRESDNGEDFQG